MTFPPTQPASTISQQLGQLKKWMDGFENEHLEFKEAKSSYEFEKLVDYCAALANEGGGKIILGVTDKLPRRVVGTKAFDPPMRTVAGMLERLRLKVDAQEVTHPDGRVLVFHVPSRPVGVPVDHRGKYWMRAGEDLVPMSPDQLKRILDETTPDFSASVVPGLTVADLDPVAIQRFRELWVRKSTNQSLAALTVEQLLADAELISSDGVTYAALILLGSSQALGKLQDQPRNGRSFVKRRS